MKNSLEEITSKKQNTRRPVNRTLSYLLATIGALYPRCESRSAHIETTKNKQPIQQKEPFELRELNQADYDQYFNPQSKTPILLIFSAEWCSACRDLEAEIPDLANKYKNVRMYKLSLPEDTTDESPKSIESELFRNYFDLEKKVVLPTIILFRGGKILRKYVPKYDSKLNEMIESIESLLKKYL